MRPPIILACLFFIFNVSFSAPVISDNLFSGQYPELPQLTTTPVNWTEGSFSAGDTTESFDVSHASVVYIIVRDSALTGTDSLWFGTLVTLNNGLTLKGAISLHNLATTTVTTFITNPIIPGNNSTVIYTWNPTSVAGTKFTGTIFFSRLNVNDNVTPYVPVTRFAYTYE